MFWLSKWKIHCRGSRRINLLPVQRRLDIYPSGSSGPSHRLESAVGAIGRWRVQAVRNCYLQAMRQDCGPPENLHQQAGSEGTGRRTVNEPLLSDRHSQQSLQLTRAGGFQLCWIVTELDRFVGALLLTPIEGVDPFQVVADFNKAHGLFRVAVVRHFPGPCGHVS